MAERWTEDRRIVVEVAAAAVATAGAALAIVGSALPWLYTGERGRSSFEVFPLVDRLGFAPGGAVAWAIRLWPLVPLLVVLTAVLVWWSLSRPSLRWAALGCGIAAAAYAGGVGVAVARAEERTLMRIGDGPMVTAVGATLLIAATMVATVAVHGTTFGGAGRAGGAGGGVAAVDGERQPVRDR